jgi:hypothetical protein
MGHRLAALAVVAGVGMTVQTWAMDQRGFGLSVLMGGSERPELYGRGKTYVEAVRGREYTLRLTNPLPRRVAVALSVDGLNTIDAKHTAPQDAMKWVLGPYESVEISGWQVNSGEARRFYFTGERRSYAAYLGATDNLGVIEAVFYREREPVCVWCERRQRREEESGDAPAAADSGRGAEAQRKTKSLGSAEEYAGTGIGNRTDHRVERVALDLETSPAAVVRIRYEFRAQLVRLGLLPSFPPEPDPIKRRESARGFDGTYCPDPYAR